MRVLLKSASATKKFAAGLAKKIISNRSNLQRRKAMVVALIGDLGAGKTTFVQAFLKPLGVKGRIISPTFLIFRPYTLNAETLPAHAYRQAGGRQAYTLAYHVDCYRIHHPKELNALGFQKILKDPKNIVLIEWADRIKKILPKGVIWLEFSHGQEVKTRLLQINFPKA